MRRVRPLRALLPLLAAVACASPPAGAPRAQPAPRGAGGAAVVAAAVEMLGVPYRYGGASPTGFDCSGLVVYAYDRAGYSGLPHSTQRLAGLAEPVPLDRLAPGDLLIFELAGKKPSHVGIYAGGRRFIHAPSSGGRVELVDFDHVYWSRYLRRAGRLLRPDASLARR